MTKHDIGSWKLLVVLALLMLDARAEPPPTNSGQGTRLHGTGELEYVNIRITDVFSRCRGLHLEKGAFNGRRADGKPCTREDLIGTLFSASFAGEKVDLTIQEIRDHQSILAPMQSQAPDSTQSVSANSLQGKIPKTLKTLKTLKIPTPKIPAMGLKLPGLTPASSEVMPEYKVAWKLKGSTMEPKPLCRTSTGANHFALALPYAWSMAGELISDSKYFTFTCVPYEEQGGLVGGGVIAKCIDWGYPPWVSSKKIVDVRDEKTQALARHETCARMAIADYCGEGKANTLEGTPIGIYDVSAFKDRGDQKPMDSIEAAWGMDSFGRTHAVCLSKARWDSLALEGVCVARKKGDVGPYMIRVNDKENWLQRLSDRARNRKISPGIKPVLCQDKSINQLKKMGALIFSSSQYLDRVLVTFERKAGNVGQFLTTADVTTLDSGQLSHDNWYLPGESIEERTSYKQLRVEGIILRKDIEGLLKGTPASFQSELIQLHRCRNQEKQGYFLVTQAAGGCEKFAGVPVDIEGFIFRPNTTKSRLKPLYLWRNMKEGGLASSMSRPAEGYEKVTEDPLGYLPVMDQLTALPP